MVLTSANKYSNLSHCSCLEDPFGLHEGSSFGEPIIDDVFDLGNFAAPPGLDV